MSRATDSPKNSVNVAPSTLEGSGKPAGALRFTFSPTDRNPNMDDSDNMTHWRCTLTLAGRRMTLVFSKGSGHNGAEPTLTEVMECLASDASFADDSYEGFCSDLGYNTDSRKALRTYRAAVRQNQALRRVLGAQYEATIEAALEAA